MLEPVVAELVRRGRPVTPMLVGKAAEIARRDGVPQLTLEGATLAARAEQVVRSEPALILLGTSVGEVVEWEVARRARGRIPTLGVLDAMLFVERRFGTWGSGKRGSGKGGSGKGGSGKGGSVARDSGEGGSGRRDSGERLDALPDVLACPDRESAVRLVTRGAAPARVVVTGNPTLEAIAAEAGAASDGPLDVLFVSQPVARAGAQGSPFAIDERASLAHVLAALAELAHLAPHGYRVRVRPHPIERLDRLPTGSAGVELEVDGDPDRLRSVARARVVVGLSSTLLAEARMLPRHAVAYLPGPGWAHEPVYAAEQGVRLVRSRADLRDGIAEAMRSAPAPPPLDAHRGATGRVADLALGLAGQGTPGR